MRVLLGHVIMVKEIITYKNINMLRRTYSFIIFENITQQ